MFPECRIQEDSYPIPKFDLAHQAGKDFSKSSPLIGLDQSCPQCRDHAMEPESF